MLVKVVNEGLQAAFKLEDFRPSRALVREMNAHTRIQK